MIQERKYYYGGLVREQGKNILRFVPVDKKPTIYIEITDNQVMMMMKDTVTFAWNYFNLTLIHRD